jgi:hypothetical protein
LLLCFTQLNSVNLKKNSHSLNPFSHIVCIESEEKIKNDTDF